MKRVVTLLLLFTFNILPLLSQSDYKAPRFGLTDCQHLETSKELWTCTNEKLSTDLLTALKEYREDMPKGVFVLSYTISSTGEKKVGNIVQLPRQVSENKKIDLIKTTFQTIINQKKWLPEEKTTDKNIESIKRVISNSIKIDTNSI